jgi:hypothetical protein
MKLLDFEQHLIKFGYLKAFFTIMGLFSSYYVGFVFGMPRDVFSRIGFELYYSLFSLFAFSVFVSFILAKIVYHYFAVYADVLSVNNPEGVSSKYYIIMYACVSFVFLFSFGFVSFRDFVYILCILLTFSVLIVISYLIYKRFKERKADHVKMLSAISLVTFCLVLTFVMMGNWKYKILMKEYADLEFNDQTYKSVSVFTERDGFVFGYSHENKNYILMRDSHVLYFD